MTSGRTRLRAAAAALVPGALAGTQIAGLLFFLNPHLPFSPGTVARGTAFFSSLLAAVSFLVFLPFLPRHPEKVFRWLPWSLTLVMAAAALGAWIHASYYAYFLPAGINLRLVKAGFLLALAAVVSFYTALIHQLRQRPYGWRSRALFAATALASVYFVMERREAFNPDLGPGPRATTFASSPRPQLLVVGIEAATLDAILPLAEQGRLPFFSKMLAEGCHSRMTSLHPGERKPLWITLATGKYPFQHGILSEEQYGARFLGNREVLSLLPVGIGFEYWGLWSKARPVDAGDRRVLTLWEILARLDISSALVGWPLSSPSQGLDPAGGIEVVSDRFFAGGDGDRSVWPAELAERARLFRSRRSDLDPAQVSRFGARPPEVVLRALVGDLWRQDLTFFLLEQDPQIDACFLVLPGLLEVSRSYFGGYSAVQFEGVQDLESMNASQLLAAYYTYLDEFLAKLWERSREPRLLAVVSVHGVEDAYGWRKAWQVLSRRAPLEGYIDRGPDGVLILLGDGVRANTRIGSSELVDLVPTLLYGLSFPIARDFDGEVLTNAFEPSFLARQPLTFLPSYETFAESEDQAPSG